MQSEMNDGAQCEIRSRQIRFCIFALLVAVAWMAFRPVYGPALCSAEQFSLICFLILTTLLVVESPKKNLAGYCLCMIGIPTAFSLWHVYFTYQFGQGFKLNFLSQVLAFILKTFGYVVSTRDSNLVMDLDSRVVCINMTATKAGIYELICWCLALVFIQLGFTRYCKRTVGKFFVSLLLVLPLALLVRNLLAVAIVVGFDHYAARLLNETALLYSFYARTILISVAVLASCFGMIIWFSASSVRLQEDLSSGQIEKRRRFSYLSVSLASVSCLILCTGLFYTQVGTAKQGRILIDDFHSGRWERSDQELSLNTFGDSYFYTYSAMVRYLGHDYQVSTNNNEISSQTLKEIDVLMIKTPTTAFTDSEVTAIREFVDRGGGLFVLGDHSNLLGMAGYLNNLLEWAEVRFEGDSVNRLSTTGVASYNAESIFQHPLTREIESFEFMTGCSISVGNAWQRVMLLDDALMDALDYSKRSFFGDIRNQYNEDFGSSLQCAERNYGAGRIVLFADSTVFSDFCLFVNDHEILLRNCIDFLNRTCADTTELRTISKFISLAGIVCAFIASASLGGFHLSSLMSFSAVLSFLSIIGISHGSSVAIESTETFSPISQVKFVYEPDIVRFPPIIGATDPIPRGSFNTLSLICLRYGIPYKLVGTNFAKADPADDVAMFLLNPLRDFVTPITSKLEEYLSAGGMIAVIDDSDNPDSGVQELIKSLGIQDWKEPNSQWVKLDSRVLRGVYVAKYKAGTLVVVPSGEALSDMGLGHVLEKPDLIKGLRFQDVYKLFREQIVPRAKDRGVHVNSDSIRDYDYVSELPNS